MVKMFGESYIVIFGLVTVSLAGTDNSRKLDILRERVRRLESRVSEDISLIREEFYDEISALIEEDNDVSADTLNALDDAELDGQEASLIVKLETLKNALLTKMKVFDGGRKQGKRIRREIQDEISVLNSEKADVSRSISEMSDKITSKIGDFIEKIHVNENLEEVVELLENLNTQLVKNFQIKSEESNKRVSDCFEWLRSGHTVSGVYTVFPENVWRPIKVYCDMDTLGGGWTVFQRRLDGSENFNRKWVDYTFGFGNLSGEFWLGNEFIHRLTSRAPHELRIELEDFENEHRNATYGLFSVGSADDSFKLSVNFFTGDVADSFGSYHNGLTFSTSDNGPTKACSDTYKAGWWYGSCHAVNINGLYLKGEHKSYANGVNWNGWRGYHYSLKKTEMKFRPH